MATSTLGNGTLVLAGTTSGTTTVTATAVAGTTTLTLPAATDTLVGKATTDTLTNKTLTGAVMNGTLGATTPSTVAATTVQIGTNPAGVSIGVLGIPNQKRVYGRNAANSADVSILYVDGSNGLVLGPSDSAIINSSGNLGIGTSSPNIAGVATALTVNGTDAILEVANGGTLRASVYGNASGGAFSGVGSSGIRFFTSASGATTLAVTIDTAQNLLVGKTLTGLGTAGTEILAGGIGQFTASGDASLFTNRLASDGDTVKFYRATSLVGSISVTTTLTSYNVTSDYRLKNTIAPMTGALAKVALLKPCTYKWNVDSSDGEGFIAHELAEVCPDAVTGQKDAVDAEGKPQYQGIDTSFLVATLTAAIQELKAEFDAYKASHP